MSHLKHDACAALGSKSDSGVEFLNKAVSFGRNRFGQVPSRYSADLSDLSASERLINPYKVEGLYDCACRSRGGAARRRLLELTR
ncbi:hypothetical protein EVAR_24507_1 [Eumeta japonica]|uniref:Uncharacterized protein n=1 Tax=Eumeta variegata TaxID=151549 RepID=A0A4C1UQV7_EUMVA|nr:hypothetical protein EVAR_24507_1 [Eumeta japonica]